MISLILEYINSLFQSFVDAFYSLAEQSFAWLDGFLRYCLESVIYLLAFTVQQIVLALIYVANSAILLLPSCNVPLINTSVLQSSYNDTGSTLASVVSWVLPMNFLATLVLCMVQAIMAYIMISWVLRWLKVIK